MYCIKNRKQELPSGTLEEMRSPQWRGSAHHMLGLSGDPSVYRSALVGTVTNSGGCTLLSLPRELRHIIEQDLYPVDTICLRQTCRALRSEARQPADPSHLENEAQRYLLRRRMDRDRLAGLCLDEEKGKLDNQLALCSFCSKPHDKDKFTAEQLRVPAHQRVCILSTTRLVVLGSYSTTPAILRRILHEMYVTGYLQPHIHYTIPTEADQEPRRFRYSSEFTLRDLLNQSYVSVHYDGLAVEHHIHFPRNRHREETPYAQCDWASFMEKRPEKKSLAICPHYDAYTAATSLVRQEQVRDRKCPLSDTYYAGKCGEDGCQTFFSWYHCRPGYDGEICFRVQRRFGWVETVEDLEGKGFL